jgi:hypothetical protein
VHPLVDVRREIDRRFAERHAVWGRTSTTTGSTTQSSHSSARSSLRVRSSRRASGTSASWPRTRTARNALARRSPRPAGATASP